MPKKIPRGSTGAVAKALRQLEVLWRPPRQGNARVAAGWLMILFRWAA